jgi:hypothetical protein
LRLRSIAIFLFAKSIADDREFANRLESMNAARSGEVLKYFPAKGRLTPPLIGKAKKGNKWIQF